MRLSEKPVEANEMMKDQEQVNELRKDVTSDPENIDRTLLPGNLKLWCMQFRLTVALMFPLL